VLCPLTAYSDSVTYLHNLKVTNIVQFTFMYLTRNGQLNSTILWSETWQLCMDILEV